MPTAVIKVTAETGFNLIPHQPRTPANSTVIMRRITMMQLAAHGLNSNKLITQKTANAIMLMALKRFVFKSRYCSQKVKATPFG